MCFGLHCEDKICSGSAQIEVSFCLYQGQQIENPRIDLFRPDHREAEENRDELFFLGLVQIRSHL